MTLLGAASSQIAPHGLTAWDGIKAGIIIVAAIFLSQVGRRIVVRAFGGEGDGFVARMVGRVLAYVVVLGGLVYALIALRVQIAPLIGALGIGGIALAFALQDILQNLVAGVILQAKRPIRVGDTVQMDAYTGVVRDIDLRTVLVRTFDGLDVYLPNRTVLENPIVNYTMSPLRRLTLTVGVAYRADLEEVQRVLLDATRSVDGVLADPPPGAWVTDFGPSSMDFSLIYWIRVTANFWQIQHDVVVATKRALDGIDVEIPFTQQTISFDPEAARLLAGPDRVPGS